MKNWLRDWVWGIKATFVIVIVILVVGAVILVSADAVGWGYDRAGIGGAFAIMTLLTILFSTLLAWGGSTKEWSVG